MTSPFFSILQGFGLSEDQARANAQGLLQNRSALFQIGTPFNPEGDGYDYATALMRGLQPVIDEEDGMLHWPSRDPDTGMLLKGRAHPTFQKGVDVDATLGYGLLNEGGRYYTRMK